MLGRALAIVGRSLDHGKGALQCLSQPMSDHHQPRGESHTGIFVMHEKLPRLHHHAETSHTEHGLSLIVDGYLRMEHGSELRVEPGSLLIIPAGAPHRPIEGRDLDLWLVGFCASCVRMDETQLLMQPFLQVRHGALPVVAIPSGKQRKLIRLFRELQAESERHAPDAPELSRCLLSLILGEVRRAMPMTNAGPSSGSLVADALAFIQQHCLEPISLKDVAASVYRTPSHVASTIKTATGYSVGDWIRSGRVGEATNRLAHTDASLDEIAAHVGWQDKTHFIRQFRKVHGVTPAAWRKQHAQSHVSD